MKLKFFLGILLATVSLSSCKFDKKNEDAENATSSENRGTTQPNIIYILADDLGYGDLSSYGQQKFTTPNIDALATKGMLFTQHYSGSTVCAPSRSVLMTGLHTGHTYIRGNKEIKPEGQQPIPDETFTLAESLKNAGYTTGAFGKWGLGFPGSEGDPINQGFDVFYGYNCQRLGHNYYPRHLWSNNDSIVIPENAGQKKGAYAPILIHQQTLKFIEDNKDKPFFAYVPSIIPHAELVVPEAYHNKYKGKLLPEKNYKGVDDGPNYRNGPYESQSESHAAFAGMINLLDDQVGEIVAKLEELGLTDNTIIVFTSDNGPHKEGGADPDYFESNGPLRGYKRDLYEGGIRVPMIVKWPGQIAANTRTDHISAFWDVFPTFSDIAGIEIPKDLDGISFLPTLIKTDAVQINHDYLYWEFYEGGGRRAVRKGDWKAVKYNLKKNPNAPIQLYNLNEDLGETTDVAGQHPDIIAEMETIFQEASVPSEINW
ncbi:arylsulfatase [Cellulophaga sp. F20128]|uniref:arylsulfatase n=1 Tax=Cellulophaga sp. F20128 TaxID=2926413 RepID=UPI001FF5776F|nr:arylsulfatase [Cellulophaga sp. F20128]MCK0156150.1 arylsulfatase [Cellulophaga sp. F20128]